MDRLFVIDKEYWNCREVDADARTICDIVKRMAKATCDDFVIHEGGIGKISALFRNKGDVIPVGDIPFVEAFLSEGGHITPIEVPESLRKYTERLYGITTGNCILENTDINLEQFFVKDATVLKFWNNLFETDKVSREHIIPEHNYVISERVEFLSEYRVFVYKDEVLAVQPYLGDPLVFPDAYRIKEMINAYKTEERPDAYTLDIGVIETQTKTNAGIKMMKTVPIEVHPFISCGLYGFEDKELLNMLAAGWRWALEHCQGGQ